MKSIVENINESVQLTYRVSISADSPVDATIIIDKKDQKDFERWLDNEEGGIFAHADGGNINY